MSESPPRQRAREPLHERSDSLSNSLAPIRIVPRTPPRLLGQRDEVYSRTPLPTHPSHFLGPGKHGSLVGADQFHPATQGFSGSSVSTTHSTPQPVNSATGSLSSKPKSLPKKRLHVHSDNKTFSLLQDSPDNGYTSPSGLLSMTRASDSLPLQADDNAAGRSISIASCIPPVFGAGGPGTPSSGSKQLISVDPITSSPWNYELVGGLRKVPKTPDLKQKIAATTESPLPPPEVSDGPHDLSLKPSFLYTATTTSEISENTNYEIHSPSEVGPPSSSGSNYRLLGDPSPASSGIYRPQTSTSENENYQLHGDSSPETSLLNLVPSHSKQSKYSQESLIVPPLQPRARRSNENFGYYKSRSRESLRTGSLTSISTVLSQQEAFRAVVGSGSLIQLPILKHKPEGLSSWAESSHAHPPRSHMNEHPHQWSSQLSTVLSESDEGTDRGSRSWSDEGQRSSGFPSTQSRHSRQMLSISSSLAQEEGASRSRSDSVEPPAAVHTRHGQRHLSSSSIRIVGDQDEYGDGITDMQDLRLRPSRTRLSSFFSVPSSDNERTNTMRSTTSSRANSLLANSIPTWARLYYGSGERRYLGAPGSPRRRPREMNPLAGGPSTRGSMEITPAPQLGSDGRLINDPYTSRPFRTWSMSSIWSPHLRIDRRDTRRSVWEPPSVNWSTEGGWFGRRNVQIVMFIAGFIFPFAWMIAALLPLPSSPMPKMRERDLSTSNLDGSYGISNDYERQFGPIDEARFESAKWWRRLNRWMSFVGLIIIAAVVVLIVISIRNSW